MSFLILFLCLGSSVFAREGILVGGFSDRNAADYVKTAWKSVPEINGNLTNGASYLVPIKVLKAQLQVVAGTNTELHVLVGESKCSKSTNLTAAQVTASNCPVNPGGARQLYKISIWEKLWENFEQITAVKIRDVAENESF